MSGVTEVRLYRNTVDEVPAEYTNVTTAVLNSSTKNHATGVRRYLDGVTTVSGLDPETTYFFWVELIDDRGNTAGPQPIGSHTTDALPPPDVWEFFAEGAAYNYQTVNRLSYTGAGSYILLDYEHVEVFNNYGKSAQIMDDVEEEFGDQLTWGFATPSEPIQAFTITIPHDYSTQIPETGWQWTHGARNGGNLGAWKILRNGVELNHTAMVNPGNVTENLRTINEV